MSRVFNIVFLAILFFIPATVAASDGLGFEGEFTVENLSYIAVGPEGRVYTTEDGEFFNIRERNGGLVKSLSRKDKGLKGVLKEPAGVAVYGDKVYVSDSSLGHIAVFSLDGKFLNESFGRSGSKPRQFKSPGGIAVYKGIIYVADTGNGRVQIIGPNGVYMGQFGSDTSGGGGLKKPVDVALDSRGYVYIADVGLKAINVYNQKGQFIRNITSFEDPVSVSVIGGSVYVGDRGKHKVSKLDMNFAEVHSFGAEGEGTAKFKHISAVAVTPEGIVYVADTKRGNVQIFKDQPSDNTDNLTSMPPPTFFRVTERSVMPRKKKLGKITWDGKDRYYVIDHKDNAVLAIRKGKQVRQVIVKGWEPVSVAVDPKGGLWALDADSNSIVRINERGHPAIKEGCKGKREGCFSDPVDMAISSKGMIYVADRKNSWIQLYNTDGMPINLIGQDILKEPLAIALDPSGVLYVLDEADGTVISFTPEGKSETVIGPGGVLKKPISIAVTSNEIFVLDDETTTIKVFDKSGMYLREFGSRGEGAGDMDDPASIVAVDDITIAVADTGNNRIEGFQVSYTPSMATGLSAQAGIRSAALKWERNPESYVNAYIIYRAASQSGPFTQVGQVEGTSYDDTGLEPEKEYFYKVAALAREGNEGMPAESVSAVPDKYSCSAPASLKAEPREWSVDLSWQKTEGEHVKHYRIFNIKDGKSEEIGQSEEPVFIHVSLEPNTEYEYSVMAVSTDMVESESASIRTKTLVATRPPIEIEVLDAENIFSNSYKYYEENGVGTVRIRNNTRDNISRLKMAFTIKEFMDFPSEVEVDDLPPMGLRDIKLKAVFNNRILEVSEDTPVQTEIAITYYVNDEIKSFTKSHTLNIYESHRMIWDVRERMAVFVTTKDPVVIEFARSVVTQYSDTSDPLLYAGVVFDALGAMGVTYMPDPSNSYQITSGKVDYVDYIQYPRETLERKSGDCDDLVILYSATLESLGIRTRVLDIPGHMFMMFSMGTVQELGDDDNDGWFVVQDGLVWVPVEVTQVGKPFMKAWELGSGTYYKWLDENKVGTMSLRTSWNKFKPATLKPIKWRAPLVTRKLIEKTFNDEFNDIRRVRIRIMGKQYVKALRKNPEDMDARLQLGIIFAQNGDTVEAMRHLERAERNDPDNTSVILNMGNVNYLEGKFAKASQRYAKAAELEPGDALIWVSLARTLLLLNDSAGAMEAFDKAAVLDPKVPRKFRSLALKLRGPM